MTDAEGSYDRGIFIPTGWQIIDETTDQHQCRALILFDPKLREWWWSMYDELEGPFDTREDAERDLHRR